MQQSLHKCRGPQGKGSNRQAGPKNKCAVAEIIECDSVWEVLSENLPNNCNYPTWLQGPQRRSPRRTVLVANLLGEGELSPFPSREAKPRRTEIVQMSRSQSDTLEHLKMPTAPLKAPCLGPTPLLYLSCIISLNCRRGYESRIHFSQLTQ